MGQRLGLGQRGQQQARQHGPHLEESLQPSAVFSAMRENLHSMNALGKRLGHAAVVSLLPAWLVSAQTGETLKWTLQAGNRFATVNPAGGSRVGFTPLPPSAVGLEFTNFVPAERHWTNQIYLNGSGVTAGDVDGDGWCDVFFSGLGGRSALYRNLGPWKFQNVTAASGLALTDLDATGAALADLDGDGDLDLVVNSVGQGTHCYLNDGKGHFAPASATPVLNPGRCGTSLALADLDGDGTLDLYIANYRTSTIRDQPTARFTVKEINGEPQVVSIGGRLLTEPDLTNRFTFRFKAGAGGGGAVLHDELGEPDVLYRQTGPGRFEPVPFTGGAFLDERGVPLPHPPFDWGLSVMIRDLNGDGTPDIYVCNDFTTPDRIWINDGRGRFRALPTPAIRQISLSTMAMDVADINRDGFDDIFTADMLSRERWRRLVQRNEPNPNMPLFVDVTGRPQFPRNMLQLNRGDGTYAEIAQMAGLEASEWTWTSIFLDVDLDGYEDLLVANGFERDYMNMDANRRVKQMQMRGGGQMTRTDQLRLNALYPRLPTANLAFRNLGNLRFVECSRLWGFDLSAISQGVCLADLDNDGDLDVLVNNLNGPAALLRNDSSAARVAVRLKGRPPNTRGIGARITLRGGAVPMQSQEMMCGGRYQSSDEAMRVFAGGSPTHSMTLEVAWRSGARSSVTNVQGNRIYEIEEGSVQPGPSPAPLRPPPTFQDVSSLLAHRQAQESFDDFERQPLLPNKLSTLGPGVSWFDVDGDGWDDLVLGGGRGSKLALYRNDRRGRFTRLTSPALDQPLARSQTTVLGCRAPDGQAMLLAGSSNYEDGQAAGSVVRAYEPASQRFEDNLPGSASSTGPLALADVDGDGKLDLFVGGRCLPGRWPEAASSLLFRQIDGQWVLDPENTRRLAGVGLVSGAAFADLDGDADPDLVLACEWGPVRVFRNDRGQLTEATEELGLASIQGWWNGVSAGDFDGDGRLDLVASNWGRNTKYERFRSSPLRLVHGDFNGDGSVGLFESCFDEALNQYAPILNIWTMSRSFPWLLEKYSSFESFSRIRVEEALGDRAPSASRLEANWLDSTLFLNRGQRFEARPLPVGAQVAPAFAVCVADFDGDGREDVFLSQNFFATRADTSRYDAGRGLLLRGDGRGEFAAVPGQESGLLIYGEQRGAAACDYDQDGRVDLAVAQVDAETKLYRNLTARPGLRVRLQGPPGNPQGVGAMLRLQSGDRLGPAREVHAGAGYWSQDSAVQVLSATGTASGLWVRWPGGKVTTANVPAGAAEVAVGSDGTVRVSR